MELCQKITITSLIYEIRAKGFTEKLTNDELTNALLHLTKNRDTTIEGLDNANDKDSEGTKAALSKNAKALAKEHYICKVQLTRLQEQLFNRSCFFVQKKV